MYTLILKKAAMAFSEFELHAILSTVAHLAMQCNAMSCLFLSFFELELHAILSTVPHLAMQCHVFLKIRMTSNFQAAI